MSVKFRDTAPNDVFAVKNEHTGKFYEFGFRGKGDAKTKRDELLQESQGWHVTIGAAHWRYNG